MGQSSWLWLVNSFCVLTAAIGLCCWFHRRWNSDYWAMPPDYPIYIPLCLIPFIRRACSIQGEFTTEEQKSLKFSRINWNKPYILNITLFNRAAGLSFLYWQKHLFFSKGEKKMFEITFTILASNRAPVLRDTTFWSFLCSFKYKLNLYTFLYSWREYLIDTCLTELIKFLF